MAAVMQNSYNLSGSSNLGQALSQASQQNQSLLQELAQTEYAKPSSKSNAAYIADLQARIAKSDKEIKILHQITETERKEHLKYQESLVKRYVYKLGGSKGEKKFSDKASKEERDFVKAWQKEREERETREELGHALTQAEADRAHLEADLARNTKAQAALDALYQSIFGGPTPEFPNEDHMEKVVRQATEHFHQCQEESKKEQQAWEALNQAKLSLGKARNLMLEAEDYSRGDIFGMPFADYMERDRMSSSQAAVHIAQQHIVHAQYIQPAIKTAGTVEIDNGHLMSDIMFDNIFTDLAQHDRIKSSNAQIEAAYKSLMEELKLQGERADAARRAAASAAEALEQARKNLQDTRAQAFESYAAGGISAPPAYQAV